MGRNKVLSFFLNTLLTKIKKLDPDIFTPLNIHIGKIIQVNQLYLLIEKNNIIILPYANASAQSQSPNLVITGKLFDLGRFGLAYLQSQPAPAHAKITSLLHQHHIQCIGDMTLLQDCQTVLKTCDLDWTIFWANIVGDKLAFPITQFFNKSKQYTDIFKKNTLHSVQEYILYEKKCVSTSIEIEPWIEENMILKNDIERFKKNLALLHLRLEQLK